MSLDLHEGEPHRWRLADLYTTCTHAVRGFHCGIRATWICRCGDGRCKRHAPAGKRGR